MSDIYPELLGQYDTEGEIGAATETPPAPAGGFADPGDIYAYGPHFVRYVTDEFNLMRKAMATILAQRAQRRQEEGHRIIASGQTDASGNATIDIVDLAPGQKFVLHRLYVHAAGYTWEAPFTGSGELLIQTNGMPWSGVSLVSGAGQLPCYFSSGRLAAVEAQDGERLELKVNLGPVSTRIECRGSGVLTTVYGDDR
jgi:hypothetical protein